MKKIILLSISILYTFQSIVAQTKTDWETYNLKGKVKSMKISSNSDKNSPLFNENRYFEFNKNGMITKNTSESIGDLSLFYKKNKIIKRVAVTKYEKYELFYTYDKNGTQTERSKGENTETVSYYDKKGKLETVITRYFKGKKRGTNIAKINYYYDANDHIIEEDHIYYSPKHTTKHIRTIDANGNITELKTFLNNKLSYHKTLKYNDRGDVIEYRNFDKDEDKKLTESSHKASYIYDDKGNWIECKKESFQKNNKPVILKREIVYWK